MLPGPTFIVACPACGALHRRDTLASGNTFGARLWSDGKLAAPMLPELPAVTRCARCSGFFWLEDAPEVGAVPFFRPIDTEKRRDLVLTAVGAKRVRVLAALRQWNEELDLAGAKALLDRLPVTLLRGGRPHAIGLLCAMLVEAGARVELSPSSVEPEPPPYPPEWNDASKVAALDGEGLRAAIGAGLGRTADREVHLRQRAWWGDNDRFRRDWVTWVPFSRRPAATRENLARLIEIGGDSVEARLRAAEAARELGRFDDALSLLASPAPEEQRALADTIADLARRRVDALVLITPAR